MTLQPYKLMKGKKKMKFEWEQLDEWTNRAKVHGGWIVQSFTPVAHANKQTYIGEKKDYRIATVFVPDTNHDWMVDK